MPAINHEELIRGIYLRYLLQCGVPQAEAEETAKSNESLHNFQRAENLLLKEEQGGNGAISLDRLVEHLNEKYPEEQEPESKGGKCLSKMSLFVKAKAVAEAKGKASAEPTGIGSIKKCSLEDFKKEALEKKNQWHLEKWWQKHQNRAHGELSEKDFTKLAALVMLRISELKGEAPAPDDPPGDVVAGAKSSDKQIPPPGGEPRSFDFNLSFSLFCTEEQAKELAENTASVLLDSPFLQGEINFNGN